MGWISDTINTVADFATSDAGSEIISSGVEFGANWLGQEQAEDANQQAVEQYREGAEDAAKTITEGAEKAANKRLEGIGDIRELTEEQFNRLKDYYPELADAYAQQATKASQEFGQTLDQESDEYGDYVQTAGSQYGQRATGAASDYGKGVRTAARRFSDVSQKAGSQYSQRATGAASDYGKDVRTAAHRFSDVSQKAGRQYSQRMRQSSGRFAGIMGAGQQGAASMYRPFAAAGGQGLRGLKRIAAQDPSKLSPAQQDQLEDYRRGAQARLSSSGLRGAGRAGVAAVNEGEAEMRTSMQARNEDERRQTLQALSDLGYGASGQIAGLRMNTARDLAGNVMNTGSRIAGERLRLAEQGAGERMAAKQDAARTMFNTRGQVAGERLRLAEQGAAERMAAKQDAEETMFNTRGQVAGEKLRLDEKTAEADYEAGTTAADQRLKTANAIAQQDLQTGQQIGDLTSGYYESMADLAGQEAETKAGAIETGTSAKASAESNPAYIQAQAGLSNAKNRQATYGKLGSIVADSVKELAAGDASSQESSFY